MATAGGPDIITDGLVFGYDADDRSPRFYSGEPTINYLATGVAGYNPFTAAHWLGATLTEVGTSELNTPILRYVTTGTNYTYSHDRMLDDDFAALSSQQVAFSLYIRRVEGASNCRIRTYDNVTSYTSSSHAVTTDFTRIQMTKTLGANPTRIFVMVDNSGGGTYEFHSPQLNIGPHATQFTKLPRTGTQSLIDLKKTTTIDVSNVSFDSTAHPVFDGTGDYINLGSSSNWSFGGDGSIEIMVKPSNSTGNNRLWCVTNNATSLDAYLNGTGYNIYLHGGSVGTTTSLVQNKWNHIVVTYNYGTILIYVNGVAGTMTGTTTGYNITNNNTLFVGSFYNLNYNLYGKASVFRVYNKGLSQTEVKQNFNAYKNRFNL